MAPTEGSDLEIGLSDPSAGVVRVFYTIYTQVFGTACLDLCLFSTDLCRGPYLRMLHKVPFSHICFKCAETLHEG